MGYKLTKEQEDIIETLKTESVVCVDAKAGTGKTSTCLAVVNHFKPKKAFYTAYNKSIVVEAGEKFPSNVECKTKHAFALKHLPFNRKIEDFTYSCFEEKKLGYPQRRQIMNVMNSFFLSDSIDMDDYINTYLDKKDAKLAIKYINKMLNNEIPPTFDFLLKYLHLALNQGIIEIEYDMAILDECQDTTAVFFEIFKLIKADKKLIVGDPYQNIYGYMNTVNAFDLIDDVPVLPLTKTFRCSTAIAERVQLFGKQNLNHKFKYEGTDSELSEKTVAYISRTNGSILMRLEELINQNISFSLTRSPKEIFALPMALANVTAGKEVYHKAYKYLEKEYEKFSLSGIRNFYVYLMEFVEDEELHSAIGFMQLLRDKKINLFELKKKAEQMVANPNIWVVTAHSFKGREVDTVYIEDSMNRAVNKIIVKGGPENKEEQEELNLGYVAATRAKHKLINCTYL